MMFLDKLALTLAIIGGLNWAPSACSISTLWPFICGGSGTWIARVIYVVVALAALWCLTLLFRPTYEERHQGA